MQNETLQVELEKVVADDPDLLRMNGVVAWFTALARTTTTPDEVLNVLDYRPARQPLRVLKAKRQTYDDLVPILAMECERRGIAREAIRSRLQKARSTVPDVQEGHALEALALLFPDDQAVRDVWREYSALDLDHHSLYGHRLNLPAYLAVAYAGTSASDIVRQVERDLGQLSQTLWMVLVQRLHPVRLTAPPTRPRGSRPSQRLHHGSQRHQTHELCCYCRFWRTLLGLDEPLLNEIERRVALRDEIQLASVLRDPVASSDLSVRTIFTRITDSTLDMRTS